MGGTTQTNMAVYHSRGKQRIKMLENPMKPVIINQDDLILIMREIRLMLIFCFFFLWLVFITYTTDIAEVNNILVMTIDLVKAEREY